MKHRVQQVINNYMHCLQRRKAVRLKGYYNHRIRAIYHQRHIDLLGPIPSTKKNYTYILAIVDAFTKFMWLYSTKTTTTGEMMNRLQKQAFSVTQNVISDRGTTFTSNEFQEYYYRRKKNRIHVDYNEEMDKQNVSIASFRC